MTKVSPGHDYSYDDWLTVLTLYIPQQPGLQAFVWCVACLGGTETATQSAITSTTGLPETTTTTTTTTTTPTTVESATTAFPSNATDDYDDLHYNGENLVNSPNAQKSLEADNDESRLDPLIHGNTMSLFHNANLPSVVVLSPILFKSFLQGVSIAACYADTIFVY